jgi:hypothetical protein
LLASDVIPQFAGVERFINDGTLTSQVAKMVDTGLYATYILLAIAILSILCFHQYPVYLSNLNCGKKQEN